MSNGTKGTVFLLDDAAVTVVASALALGGESKPTDHRAQATRKENLSPGGDGAVRALAKQRAAAGKESEANATPEALLDRLTHKVHIIDIKGDSYRFRESLQAKEGGDKQAH